MSNYENEGKMAVDAILKFKMRFRSSIILALLCAVIVIWPGASQGTVVINVVESNPAGDESAHKTAITAWFDGI